jgi:hypothetical protein
MPDEQLLQSGHWSAGSESSLCPAPLPFDDGWRLHLRRKSAFPCAAAALITRHGTRSADFAKVAICAKRSSGIAKAATAANDSKVPPHVT